MSAVLSDISMEWLLPETKEVLLSPVGNTFLFPGDSLIGYSVVCDTTRYHTNPKSVSDVFMYSCKLGSRVRRGVSQINADSRQDKRRRYSMMRSVESASSVFYHSQEEDTLRMGMDTAGSRDALAGPLYELYHDSMTDGSPVSRDADPSGRNVKDLGPTFLSGS